MPTPPPAPEPPEPGPDGTPTAARRDLLVLAAGGALFLGLLLYSAVWRRHGALAPAAALLVAAGLFAALRAARVGAATVAVVLVGLGLQVVYFGWTGPLHRNFDAEAQLVYVRYILEHHALPSSATCVICHHPPLYYLLAAGVRWLLERGHVAHVDSGLQALSLVLFAVFVLYSTLVIERLAPRRWPRTLATALVVFWPYTIINAVRIHNDVPLYALAAVAFYHAVRWTQEGARRHLVVACATALVGLFVKANAAILVGLILVLAAYRVRGAVDRRAELRRSAPVLGLLLVLAVGGSLLRGERGEGFGARVLGTAYSITSADRMARSAHTYLTFDVHAFLTQPVIRTGRFHRQVPSYWTHLLKSSLHGTRVMLQPADQVRESPRLARAAAWALLALTLFLVAGVALTLRAPSGERTIALLAAGVWIGAGLAFHLLAPNRHHADFRLIYPVLVPLSLLYAQAVDGLRRRRFRPWPAWVAVAALFVVVNAAYFVPAVIARVEPGWTAAPAPLAPGGAPPPGGRLAPRRPRPLLLRPPLPASQRSPAP